MSVLFRNWISNLPTTSDRISPPIWLAPFGVPCAQVICTSPIGDARMLTVSSAGSGDYYFHYQGLKETTWDGTASKATT